MYGAIAGDMIGSPFEFDRGDKTKEFALFSRESHFTDDSVMTIAVAEALLNVGKDAGTEAIKGEAVKSMRKWGRRYPHAGYGSSFIRWLQSANPGPYNSWGNGSAMRVSPAGWLYDSLDRTREVARATAEVTHNHPEGIKGAEATASAIFLSRSGWPKERIKEYIARSFGYDLDTTCDEIRPGYRHVESCQQTVPQAIRSFIEGESFEDVVRTAVSLGGDCDTLTCIAASIAEAYYGIDGFIKEEVRHRVRKEMLAVIDRFYEAAGRKA